MSESTAALRSALRGRRIALAGVGLLGGRIAFELLPFEPEALRLIDPGLVEPGNVPGQGFGPGDLGRPKVEVRAEALCALAPGLRVHLERQRVEDLGLAVLRGTDLLVASVDSHASRLHLGWVAKRLGIPLLDAAVAPGGRPFATLSLYAPGEAAACPGCRHRPADLARLAHQEAGPACGDWRGTPGEAPATGALPAFGSVTAGLAAWLAARALSGDSQVAGTRLVLELAPRLRLRVERLARSARCLFPHAPLAPLRATRARSPGELVRTLARERGAAPRALRLERRWLAVGLACPRCGREEPAVRERRAFQDAELRCACTPEPGLAPVELVDRIEGALLERVAGTSWSALGLPQADVVSAELADGGALHFVLPEEGGSHVG